MAKKQETILLVGNPNVGKSVLFNHLTGANAVVSNYPGTTVDYLEGSLTIGERTYTLIDTPGAYSLEARDKAEEVAVKMLHENRSATVIIVLDASRIERGLYIALEVIETHMPAIVALNMMDVAKDKQIEIDVSRLEKILDIPVVPVTATSGEGLKDLTDMIGKAHTTAIEEIRDHSLKRVSGVEDSSSETNEGGISW